MWSVKDLGGNGRIKWKRKISKTKKDQGIQGLMSTDMEVTKDNDRECDKERSCTSGTAVIWGKIKNIPESGIR